MIVMIQDALAGFSSLLFGAIQAAVYGYLFLWSFKIIEGLPLEKYFKKVRFYHFLVLSLILASLAISPVKYVLTLLFSFFSIPSESWLFSVFSFAEGAALLWLLSKLARRFGGLRQALFSKD